MSQNTLCLMTPQFLHPNSSNYLFSAVYSVISFHILNMFVLLFAVCYFFVIFLLLYIIYTLCIYALTLYKHIYSSPILCQHFRFIFSFYDHINIILIELYHTLLWNFVFHEINIFFFVLLVFIVAITSSPKILCPWGKSSYTSDSSLNSFFFLLTSTLEPSIPLDTLLPF